MKCSVASGCVIRIKKFGADASHDLRTPVALIRASAELALRRSRTEEEYRETLSRVLTSAEETTHLIENLLALARADAGAADLHFKNIDLIPHLEKIAMEACILTAAKGIEFLREVPAGPVQSSADAAAIERLLLIVLENAVNTRLCGAGLKAFEWKGARELKFATRESNHLRLATFRKILPCRWGAIP